jgi:hypothetical protein
MTGPKLICMIAWSQVANLQRITPISHHQMCHLTSDPKFNSLTFHNSLFVFMLKLAPKFCLPLKHFHAASCINVQSYHGFNTQTYLHQTQCK